MVGKDWEVVGFVAATLLVWAMPKGKARKWVAIALLVILAGWAYVRYFA